MNIGMFPKETDQTDAALTMARAAGCTRDPDIHLPGHRDRAGLQHVRIAHDDHCRLLVRLERRN